ncbi:MAG: translocation/assembly module TamB domain-containing protein, partial [Proteiniphilum sp.]|nr:translocation/assembly module TamB domain-containing protein [Proteiniphilum sp.]
DFNDATINYRKEQISINNFGLREENMLLLGIEGVASKSEADFVRIYFNNTELANILAAFNVSNFAGSINGDIFVRQMLESPMVHTEDLRIEDITVYNDTIGTFTIEANWDNLYSGLDLNAYLVNGEKHLLDLTGYVPLGGKSPLPMDVSLRIQEFDLKAVQPLTTNIFSELSGLLNSEIAITGKPSAPVTRGWLGIDKGEMKVAFTNVTYSISDTIDINPDNVGLRNLVIRDQNNQTATVNLNLSHTNFGGMAYNASIRMNDFMLLNNENRTDLMTYGNLRLSGDLTVSGSPAGIYGDGTLTSTSRSEVSVVLPQTARATEYSGVVYINTPQENDSLAFLRKNNGEKEKKPSSLSSGIPIVMRVTVNLTPMLEAAVVLDPTTGNALEVSGEGEVNVEFNSKSTPPVRLYGDYVISSGKFHYNLQNLRTIDFRIREGSRLTMEGNPLNTQFNITAYLPVKADLAALSPTFTTELANTRVQVNALLHILGNLEAMDLRYDIELPESSNDIQQRVNSFINTEETKILQFAYLATTGSFIPSEGSPEMNFGPSVFSRFASNTLARGLDALFASALSDNWSISTNLESVDGTLDNVRMGVDVSTRLLDDRLRITTNLSYGDNSMLATQQAFMGEFELEYDINNWFMIRAFNRANERFYRRTPTTQGVGVVVTKEARSFRELFDFRVIRKKEENE